MSFDYPGKCPKCGWFCSEIKAQLANFGESLGTVTGNCRQHGKMDLSSQAWEWEDFFGEPSRKGAE